MNELQYNVSTRKLRKKVEPCGSVIGFSWDELIRKFEACGFTGISKITVDDWGLHVFHEPCDQSVGGGQRGKDLFHQTSKPKTKKKIR